MAAIFISYARRDRERATQLADALRSAGLESLFLDFEGLEPGTNWQETLYARLRGCSAVVVLVTRAWFDSKWCFAEAVQARGEGKAIFPVLAESCEPPQILSEFQCVDWTTDSAAATDRLILALKSRFRPATLAAVDPDTPPYPGLAAFDSSQAGLFFGRDEESLELCETLEAQRRRGGGAANWVVVLGASGSGKSSLVRAGVLPSLREDEEGWLVIRPFRPYGDPFGELAHAIRDTWGELSPREEPPSCEDLSSGTASTRTAALLRHVEGLQAATKRGDATVLVCVDQAEELLTEEVSSTGGLLRVLRCATQACRHRLMVLLTLRSDFLQAFQTHKALESADNDDSEFSYHPYTLETLPRSRFGEVIRGPARVAGIVLEDKLVDEMVADAKVSDALPLLAFTLQRLYKTVGRERRRITLADYTSRGRLDGAVQSAADQVISTEGLTPAEVEALRASFIPHLVRAGSEGAAVRRRALRASLPKEADSLIAALIEARLLVADRDREGRPTVEITHEALLRVWPLLQEWLTEDNEKLRGLSSVRHAATEWHNHSRDSSSEPNTRSDLLVHRGRRLEKAVALDAQPRFRFPDESVERTYLDACRAQEEQRKLQERTERRKSGRRRIVQAVFSVAVLALLYFVVMALLDQRLETQRANSLRLAQEARVALGDGDIGSAVELARRGLVGEDDGTRPPYSFESAAALFDILEPFQHLAAVISKPSDRHLSYLQNGGKVLGAGVSEWWIAEESSADILLTREHHADFGFVVSRDQSTALSVGPSPQAWSLANGAEIEIDRQALARQPAQFMSGDLSSNGAFAVLGSEDGALYSFSLGDAGELIDREELPDGSTTYVHAVRISPDATRLVAIQTDHLLIYEYDAGNIGEPIGEPWTLQDGSKLSDREAPLPAFLGSSSLLMVRFLGDSFFLVDVADGAADFGQFPSLGVHYTVPGVDPVRGWMGIPDRSIVESLQNLVPSWSSRKPRLSLGEPPDDTKRFVQTDRIRPWRLFLDPATTSLSVGRDGKKLVAGHPDHTLLWRVNRWHARVLFELPAETRCAERIVDAACRPADAILFSTQEPHRGPLEACLWNSGGAKHELPPVTYTQPRPGRLSEDGEHLQVTLANRSLAGFDTISGHRVEEDPAEAAQSPADAAGGATVTISNEDTLTFHLPNGGVSRQLEGLQRDLVFRPDGRLVATRTKRAIDVWETDSGRLHDRIHEAGVHCVSFAADGDAVRAVTQAGQYVEWTLPEGGGEDQLLTQAAKVSKVFPSPDSP